MSVKTSREGYVELRNKYNNGFNAEFNINTTMQGGLDMDLMYVSDGEETEDSLGLLMTLEDAYAFATALLGAIREMEEYAGLEPKDFSDALKFYN